MRSRYPLSSGVRSDAEARINARAAPDGTLRVQIAPALPELYATACVSFSLQEFNQGANKESIRRRGRAAQLRVRLLEARELHEVVVLVLEVDGMMARAGRDQQIACTGADTGSACAVAKVAGQ